MIQVEALLRQHAGVSDYKINTVTTEGYQLFFVKGTLETVRCTDNTDLRVTVYVRHGDYLGDADFPVFPSTTEEQLRGLIEEAVGKAQLINNKPYELPAAEEAAWEQEDGGEMTDLAALAAKTIFAANQVEGGSQNSVEVFVERRTVSVVNSRGIRKRQVGCSGMAEAIPTYNGPEQSVELYQQYHFAQLDPADLSEQIAAMMAAAKARYEAVKPAQLPQCPVVLDRHELMELFREICSNLNYAMVYRHAGVFTKGDAIQKEPTGDRLTITAAGILPGDPASSHFDGDGLSLGEKQIVVDGIAVDYFGDNQFGQYLGEQPTGAFSCFRVEPGTAEEDQFREGTVLEVISMSGLQVDFYTDYIGGEVRLAYLHQDGVTTPVTGISVSGSLTQALSGIRLSRKLASEKGYRGPEKALLADMKIF